MGFALVTLCRKFSCLAVMILFSSFIQVHSEADLTTLRQVQIIFRHGARTIDKTYPLDPYKNESFWPPGFSQLTNIGKLQGYNLGQFLRERYSTFVKDTYDVKEMYLRSSDIARTIQTAYSVMAGFYSPSEISTGNFTLDELVKRPEEIPLPWKSVPAHTVPVETDNVIRQKPDICPRYNQLLTELTQDSPMVKQISEENRELFEYYSNHTGLNITSPLQADDYYDALVLENYYNMTLPQWTEGVFGTPEATSIALFYFQYITYTFEMKRLRVGPLLQKLVENMNTTRLSQEKDGERKEEQIKMYFFSGHDFTISGVLDTLQIYDKTRPPFASALMLELHEDSSGSQEMRVEIHYRNTTEGEAYKLEIPDCGEPCTLDKFAALVDPYIPLDWETECKLTSNNNQLSTGWIVFIIIVFWILIFVALQCWLRTSCHRRRRNDYETNYTHLK